MSFSDWRFPDASLAAQVDEYRDTCLSVYKHDSNRIIEDLRKEYSIAEGGYGRKQVQELLQNGADALRESPGRLEVRLTEDALYVANQGAAFTRDGVRGILYAHLSEKTGEEIGRFGLGFKSIAGISTAPQVFSHSVSFAFDRERASSVISEAIGEKYHPHDTPALRLAWPIEPTQEFEDDTVLRELARWATTIVKVPVSNDSLAELDQEIKEFDESFCLFVPAVKELRLRSEYGDYSRTYTTRRSGEGKRQVELQSSDGETSDWYVVTKKHKPSQAALESAGRTARRENIEVSWAVPLSGKVKVGQLSAYFPVKSEISLSGKINAPWKLSDDRIDVIEDSFNEEILTQVVPLLVGEARHFIGTDDPGRYIDILPARGRETRSWADQVINEPIYAHLRTLRSLPNADLEMRSASQLLPIPQIVPAFLTSEWLEIAQDKSRWVHPECTTSTERRSKTSRLMNSRSYDSLSGLQEWFESFVDGCPEKSKASNSITALRTMAAVQDEADLKQLTEIEAIAHQSKVVLLESGVWAPPARGQALIRSTPDDRGEIFVDQRVIDDPVALKALTSFGVIRYEDSSQLGDVLDQLKNRNKEFSDDWWEEAWTAFRSKEAADISLEFDRNLGGNLRDYVKVKNLSGRWSLPCGQYIPGEILKSSAEDADFLVDPQFHAHDHELLKKLGITEVPSFQMHHLDAEWVSGYLAENKEEFGTLLNLNRRSWDDVEIANSVVKGPLDNLAKLSQPNRARLTKYFIENDFQTTVEIKSGKTSRREKVTSPNIWKIKKDGLLKTSIGYSPIEECIVSPDEEESVADIAPMVTDLSKESAWTSLLPFRESIQQLDILDFEKLVLLHRGEDDEPAVGKTYSWYCYLYPEHIPDEITVKVNSEWQRTAPDLVALASDPEQEKSLEKFGIPTLLVPTNEDAVLLKENWGLVSFEDVPVGIDFEAIGEPQPLRFEFPNLESLYSECPESWVWSQLEDLSFQPCKSIDLVSELPGHPKARESVSRTMRDSTLYVVGQNLEEQLEAILALLDLEIDPYRFDELIQETKSQYLDQTKAQVRNAPNDAKRLALMFDRDELVAQIPAGAMEYAAEKIGHAPESTELAKICIEMYGTTVLQKLCEANPSMDLVPPKNWRGSYGARQWVKELGFDESWAGRRTPAKNTPTETVNGPTELGQFHDYQLSVSKNLRRLLAGDSLARGLITLPTGAGKTRVAVQTIVEAIAAGDMDRSGLPFNGPILWLASNEELCEQAIEAWKFLWGATGRKNTALTISRHFGNYEASEEPDGVQVVVGTFQKTVRSTENPGFDWLSETPLVVIDEAHSALNQTYTKILNWTHRSSKERDRLLLGLTATPFAGKATSERTQQLLRRFDENILDKGVFGESDPMVRLQKDRVLSHVTMEIIRSDTAIELSNDEIKEFREKQWLRKQRESELGQDSARTLRIVRSIESKPADWSIIVFAASVENAETIAAILTLDGIPSAAISSKTSEGERAEALQRFKNKELRVLTNYNVLSQGFDAPKTDAVYITRPTQSEVRYQQMIGRGLRGPKNGGTAEVHLVNVLDNIKEFRLSINYKPFEKLADSVSNSLTYADPDDQTLF